MSGLDHDRRGATDSMRVLGISGSLRRDSFNTRLLEAAGSLLPAGAELTLWDGLKAVPPFSEDDEHRPPPAVQALRDAIAEADALLIATPEYNGSAPGQLKNALDWASRPRGACVLAGKPVAVTGASPTPFGAVRAQDQLRNALKLSGARPVERSVPVPRAPAQFAQSGGLADAQLGHDLRELLEELLAAASPGARWDDAQRASAA
jgi:chromate reductase